MCARVVMREKANKVLPLLPEFWLCRLSLTEILVLFCLLSFCLCCNTLFAHKNCCLKIGFCICPQSINYSVNAHDFAAIRNQLFISLFSLQIEGYPTIKYFQSGSKSWDSAQEYNGGRDADGIVSWAMDKWSQNQPPPEVYQLVSQQVSLHTTSILLELVDTNVTKSDQSKTEFI